MPTYNLVQFVPNRNWFNIRYKATVQYNATPPYLLPGLRKIMKICKSIITITLTGIDFQSLVYALASAQFAIHNSRYRIPTLTLPLVFDETLRLSKPSARYNIDHTCLCTRFLSSLY